MKEAKHRAVRRLRRGGIKPESKHGELQLEEPSASETAERQRRDSVAGTVCTAHAGFDLASKLKNFIQ